MKDRLRSLFRPAAALGALALFVAIPVGRAQTQPPTRVSQLTNFSVRSKLGAGQTLVAGFVIAGDSSTTARILVRAVGPTLGSFGVTDAMPNPKIVLAATGPGLTVSLPNDDWNAPGRVFGSSGGVAEQPITQWGSAFPLPASSKDAAILAELKPGSYTVTVSGSTATDVGTVLLEVYNVDPRPPLRSARLANLSVMGFVNDATPLVAGFFLDGTNSENILVRAIGPGLSRFGVSGAIADCRLDLINSKGVVSLGNDDWERSEDNGPPFNRQLVLLDAQITGAFPLGQDSKDAATALTISPTAAFPERSNMVRGSAVNGTSGMMLLEIYEIQPDPRFL
ncbi:MAG: hypothetical protein NTV51_24275 [Verrucomicrobia bacterium]|nr:hypothetical protein [Verrucomicrobiota bacterium]